MTTSIQNGSSNASINENQPIQLKLVLMVVGGLLSTLIAIAAWQFSRVSDKLDANQVGQIQLVEAVKYMSGSIEATNRRLDETNQQLSGIAERLDGKDGVSKDVIELNVEVQTMRREVNELKQEVRALQAGPAGSKGGG